MTVREFVEKYKNENEKLDKYHFIENHIVKTYLEKAEYQQISQKVGEKRKYIVYILYKPRGQHREKSSKHRRTHTEN